jgi:hypothetical protein
MELTISLGEALDRLSILELKEKYISDASKLAYIAKEKEQYTSLKYEKMRWEYLYTLLVFVNDTIWNLTETIKQHTEIDQTYAIIASQILELNQQRFRLKDLLNRISNSEIQEQKSYATQSIIYTIKEWNDDTLFNIIYYLLHYDNVQLQIVPPLHPHYSAILSYKFPMLPLVSVGGDNHQIVMSEYATSLYQLYKTKLYYQLDTIFYISGGLLGDFVHQLSVVCEYYKKTGRRGVLYISNTGDPFRLGLEKAYNDLKLLILKQEYIDAFYIYNNNFIDYNLSKWRQHIKGNWYNIYSNVYDIPWGKHKWLTVPRNPDYSGKILINVSKYRWTSVDIKSILDKYPRDKLMYIALDDSYSNFNTKTGINIPNKVFTTLDELVSAIESCDLFIGNFSSPLAFTFALHHQTLLLRSHGGDNTFFIDINNHLPFVYG